MNSHDDWARWGADWQQQPAIDTGRLRRKVQWKLWRMRIFVTLELLITLVATVQCLQLIWQPGVELRLKVWAGVSLFLVAGVQAMFLHLRRGTWSASLDETHALILLCERRARAGIRLAKFNAWSTLLSVLTTLALAAPELEPQRWQHDPQLKLIIIVQFAVNAPIVIGAFAFCAWYVRRQRRKLAYFASLQVDEGVPVEGNDSGRT